MKTVLEFTRGIDKQRVILYHSPEIEVSREKKKNHISMTDGNGDPILLADYIVIKIPKWLDSRLYPKYRLSSLKNWNPRRTITTGYQLEEESNCFKVSFYDEVTFTWELRAFNFNFGLFDKIVQKSIPDKENGELFFTYINASGLRQLSVNAFCMTVEKIFELCQKSKKKHFRKKENN